MKDLMLLYLMTNGIARESVYPYLNDQWPCDLTAIFFGRYYLLEDSHVYK